MGSLSKLMKEKGGELGGVKTGQVKVQQIHYTKLKESDLNFYTRSEDEVTELADTMLIAGGILQPLIVRKTDLSEYEILAGHKRKRASVYNVERGYKEYEFLPCIVIDMSGLMAKKISEKILAEKNGIEDEKLLDMIAEYIIICTNSTASESSHYEKMMQAVRLSKILPSMLENEELKGRALRAEIAKEMKCGDGQVGRYQSIYNNLVPEAMERFRDNRITFSVAYGLSGLDRDWQQSLLKKQQITMADIDLFKQEKSNETVSKLDTEKAASTELLKPEEDKKTVSKLDTEKVVKDVYEENTLEGESDSEYECVEYDEVIMNYALSLLFDKESGIPKGVMEELLSSIKDTGGHVSILADILGRILPFENEDIKLEQIHGYTICFKDQTRKRKMSVALWPFWRDFIGRYKYGEDTCVAGKAVANVDKDNEQNELSNETECKLAAVPNEDIEKTAASEEKESVQAYSIGYTKEDVKQIYDEQITRIQEIERIKKFGDLTSADEKQQKKAKIIRDGLTYILEAFKEGTIC